jgi:hypothetical protein
MGSQHIGVLSAAVVLSGFGCSGSAPEEVTGTGINTYITDSGPVSSPFDLSTVNIAALVLNGQGGFTSYPGQGTTTGTFQVPNVPAGTYYLQVGQDYLVTTARTIDLGSDVLGRSDVATVTQASTTLSVNVTGLSPWGTADQLALFSSNASVGINNLTDPNSPPMEGAVAVDESMLAYQNIAFPPNLIDGSKGDRAFITQLGTKMSSGQTTYNAVTTSLELPSFALKDGGNTALTGALMAVPQTETLTVNDGVHQFEQLVPKTYSTVTTTGDFLILSAQPGGLMYGVYSLQSVAPNLLTYSFALGSPDVNTGPLIYGNPYPKTWGVLASASTSFTVTYSPPGATTPYSDYGTITTAVDASTLGNGLLVPLIGPVQNLKVNGQPATKDLQGVTATPTISFDPPATGTAASYWIGIYQLTVMSGAAQAQLVADFYTKEQTLLVPPGILTSGNYYYCNISANSSSIDQTQSPYRTAVPNGYANTFSGMLQP